MKGNCWKYALSEQRRTGAHVWVCFRYSPYAASWWSKTPRGIRLIAIFILYELYRLIQFVGLAAFGGWFHCVVRDDMPRSGEMSEGYREFDPSEKRRNHNFPPTKYEGEVIVR